MRETTTENRFADSENMNLTVEEANDLFADFLTINTVFLYIYLITGVIGNVLVFIVYRFFVDRKKHDRFFIPFLAIADMFSCIIGCGFAISLNSLPVLFFGDAVCKFLWFATKWSTLLSASILIIIAVDRYLKVCRPFGSQMTVKVKYLALALFFIISGGLTVPTVLFHGEIRFPVRYTPGLTGARCGRYYDDRKEEFTVYNLSLLVCALLAIGSIGVLYILVGRKIYKQTQFRKRFASSPRKSDSVPHMSDSGVVSGSENKEDDVFVNGSKGQRKCSVDTLCSSTDDELQSPEADKKPKKYEGRRRKSALEKIYTFRESMKKYKISILFMAITNCFILTFTPRLAIMILEGTNEQFWVTQSDNGIRISLFFYRFYIVNNIVNPIFYALFDTQFRKGIRKMFCRELKK